MKQIAKKKDATVETPQTPPHCVRRQVASSSGEMLRIWDGALESKCQEALDQIERMQYARNLWIEGFRTVLCYGAAFLGKDCLIRLTGEKNEE
ncbi:MAG: hypothetical protein LUD12_02030 [Lachnospiraceae bacterium]|nr:hypothetical protein [Lachnospiraceae bacterium]